MTNTGIGVDAAGQGIGHPVFRIDRFNPNGVKQHKAYAAGSRDAVDASHAAALKDGGMDNPVPRKPAFDSRYDP